MKHILALLFASTFLFGCAKSNFEHDKAAITAVMAMQEECWSKGDIEGFMNGYWRSDSLRFIGKRGVTKGWQTTLDNYKKSYPDTKAMGKLKFDLISFDPLGDGQMFVVGKWTLEREKDTLAGHYSLIWRKFGSEWKVVFDHSN